MPIRFACPCGNQLEVEDEYAGQQAQCPTCDAILEIPQASRPRPVAVAMPVRQKPEPEHDDDIAADAETLNPLASKRRKKLLDYEEDVAPNAAKPAPRRKQLVDNDDDDDDYEADRPRRKPRRPKSETVPYNAFNSQTIGGIICLVLSLVIFIIGFFLDLFFVRWILVLAVVGVIGIVRGVATGRGE
jgi:hypothetical protein